MIYRVVLDDIRVSLAVEFTVVPGEPSTNDDPGYPNQIHLDRVEVSNQEKPIMMAQNIVRYLPAEVLDEIRDRIHDKFEEGSL